jgi:hypothetical protein
MKHAFLIIAHNEPVLFKKLIACLDHPDVDIFVHIDRKSDMALFDDVKTEHSFIYFIEDRIDVRWGDYSQILTEIKLFETASKRNRYLYYHLLSGIDLPIKPVDQILKWFEDRKGYEYLGAWPAEKKYHRRMHRRYFFITRKRNFATTMILALEKLFCLKWNRKTEVWMGSNWGSFTHDFVEQLLKHKDWIANHFKYSFCGDELYKPTLMRYLGIENQDKGGVRHIDWQRGNPYVFRNEDFDELMASDKLFARKFSSDDMELIERIIKYLRSESI